MSMIDLDRLSLTERKSLERDVARAITDFSTRRKTEAIIALEEHAKALGFSLAELTGAKVRKTKAGAGAAKNRHPENPAITWSGQGRKPRWFMDAVEAGKAPESMAV